MFGYDLEVYVVDHNLFVDITKNYMQLIQANKRPVLKDIPKLQDIKEETQQIEETQKPKEDVGNKTIEMGRNFFGDALDIKES